MEDREEQEGESSHQVLRDWEQIQPTSLLLQSRWEILDTHDDISVFPPSNHEGLHTTSLQQQQQEEEHGHGDDDDDDGNGNEEGQHVQHLESSESRVDLRRLFDPRFQVLGEVLMKRLRLGFEVLCSKLSWIASLVRSRRGANWTLTTATGVTAAFLTSLWWQRWRQRLRRQQKRDRLIFLLRDQNEKINQLLDQITRLNEILSTRRRVPVLGSS